MFTQNTKNKGSDGYTDKINLER